MILIRGLNKALDARRDIATLARPLVQGCVRDDATFARSDHLGDESVHQYRHLFSAFTAAGIAFPLVLFVQGQILRMAKNVRDEKNAEEFSNSLA